MASPDKCGVSRNADLLTKAYPHSAAPSGHGEAPAAPAEAAADSGDEETEAELMRLVRREVNRAVDSQRARAEKAEAALKAMTIEHRQAFDAADAQIKRAEKAEDRAEKAEAALKEMTAERDRLKQIIDRLKKDIIDI